MLSTALFGITIAFSFVVWGLVARQYFWPALRGRSRADAVRPILFLHAFRFMGLTFLIPGVVSPDLPASFARPVAYGDLATAALALLALAMLDSKLLGRFPLAVQYRRRRGRAECLLPGKPHLAGAWSDGSGVCHSDAGGAASADDACSGVPDHAAAADSSCSTSSAPCGMSRGQGRICRRLKADSGLIKTLGRGPKGPLYQRQQRDAGLKARSTNDSNVARA